MKIELDPFVTVKFSIILTLVDINANQAENI